MEGVFFRPTGAEAIEAALQDGTLLLEHTAGPEK